MAETTIRAMVAEDVPVVAAWMVTVPLWQQYGLTVDSARRQLSQGLAAGDILLVADREDARACGFVWCLPKGAFGLSAYVRLIGVRPGFTGGGLGARLLRQVEQIAARDGRDVFLLVSDFNTDAQRFYQRMGYQQIGAIPGYVLPDVAELIYRKRLQPHDG